jgi:transposase-like protein
MIKYTHLTKYQITKIISCFYLDLTASQSAEITGFNRNTINRFFNIFREAILFNSIKSDKDKIKGNIELDESYFGAKRIRGKRGRGAAGKTIVFGVLKRDDKVYLKIVKSASREELMPIIQGKILEGSTIYTDGWKAYNGLILNGYNHYRIYHSENEFARGKNHVNGIESFWSFTKNRLSKFNGFTNDKFILHLKESEYRFNNRDLTKEKFIKMILTITKKHLKNKQNLVKVKI